MVNKFITSAKLENLSLNAGFFCVISSTNAINFFTFQRTLNFFFHVAIIADKNPVSERFDFMVS